MNAQLQDPGLDLAGRIDRAVDALFEDEDRLETLKRNEVEVMYRDQLEEEVIDLRSIIRNISGALFTITRNQDVYDSLEPNDLEAFRRLLLRNGQLVDSLKSKAEQAVISTCY